MNIEINDHRKIFTIQEEFSKMFPHLKMEFHAKSNKTEGAPSTKFVHHSGSKTLGECRTIHTKGQLTLDPAMTIADLKQVMNDRFGLAAEIFRKSGNQWKETEKEGIFSLAEQNNKETEPAF